jgi:hypothetical protein
MSGTNMWFIRKISRTELCKVTKKIARSYREDKAASDYVIIFENIFSL